MKFSIVIPTHNRAESLKVCLERIFAQKCECEFEVVVVDDGSVDNTEDVVSNDQFSMTDDQLRYVKIPKSHQAVARNRGVSEAKGDIIIFIGDDIYVEEGWLSAHYKFHTTHPEKEAMAVGYMTWSPELSDDRFRKWLESSGTMLSYKNLRHNHETDYWHFYTGNVSLKKSWFKTHQFDEHFKAYGWEDIMFGYSLLNSGAKLYYIQDAIAYHHHALTQDDLFPDRMREIGKSAVLFQESFPDVPVVPHGLKRFIFSILAWSPTIFFLSIFKKEWSWYAMSKRYFLEGIRMSESDQTTLIVGSYGASNIGDEAMLSVILKNLSGKKYVLSGDISDTKKRHSGFADVAPHLPFGLRSFFLV